MVERDENRGQLCMTNGVGTINAALYDFFEREVTDHPGVVKDGANTKNAGSAPRSAARAAS